MDKAEQAALKAYPISTPPSYIDGHNLLRQEAFIQGYQQAEKDLALTWEDISSVIEIYHKFTRKGGWVKHKTIADGYQEVLRRFNEYKQKTK